MRFTRTLAVAALSGAALASACTSDDTSAPVQPGGTDAGNDAGSDASLHDAGTDAPPAPSFAVARVLLLSIDGMHQVDLANFIAAHPTSSLAGLAKNGVQYANAAVNALDGTASNPSDSFPGLLALTTGGSSPTTGGWYDVSYARDLYKDSTCATPGTMVNYDESLEINHDGLWGDTAPGVGPTHDPAVARTRLDPKNMPYRKTPAGCAPVFPHDFIRVNTIFEVARAAGLHTAWSDKHLAYEMVTGPSGGGLDDFFAPEINSLATNLQAPGAGATDDFTTKYTFTEVYDDLKVKAVLNQIDGKWSDSGLAGATDATGTPGVPAIFGMNFQAVSVAQKDDTRVGGYADANGTPNSGTADALAHTDASIGKMVAELSDKGLLSSTLIVVTAKHGQSPIDHTRLQRRDGNKIADMVSAKAPVAGHIEDDVALYWLTDPATAPAGAAALQAAPANGSLTDPSYDAIDTSATPGFTAMFGDPATDPRTPSIVVRVKQGTIYSLSTTKWAEHGGFADDDSHVALLVSNPAIAAATVTAKVRTKQVAPTILAALRLDPTALQAVQKEGTPILPGLPISAPASWTPTRWTADAPPTPVTIQDGPWSLAQLAPGNSPPPAPGAPFANPSYGYCTSGVRNGNSGTHAMQPYYFPMVLGQGDNLQGFFDWRPKDINEAIVAAKSSNGGLTWTFQQSALTLTEACPADATKTNPDTHQADNGYGHPYVLEVGGVTRLYVLDRSDASSDEMGLVVTQLTHDMASLRTQPDGPLAPAPVDIPIANDGGAGPMRTVGLKNPDGILGVVAGSSPLRILYVQKQLGADTTFPASAQCGAQPFLAPGASTPRKANHDVVTVRLATTTDGVNFTDQGPVSGLNDSMTTSYLGTRWVASTGTLLRLDGSHYGLFFAGGNCVDADSDAFHYIGYAESTDLTNWTVINGVGNPIASLVTNVIPATTAGTWIPSQQPVVGPALDWFGARVYAPSLTVKDANHLVMTFAGYAVQSPNTDLLHYRQIGHVVLTASRSIPAQ